MTRDDLKWPVLMGLAVIASLAMLSETTVQALGLPGAIVPWLPWCRLVTMVSAVVGAKLGNSPLPGKSADAVSPRTVEKYTGVGVVLLACGLAGAAAVTLPACGPKQYHTAVVANTTIAQAIFAVQDAEIAAHQAQLVTDAQHADYKAQILTLLQAGDDLTVALRDWDPSKPVPANVGVAIGHAQTLLTDLQIHSPQASALLFTVQTVLSLLRGSGVLPPADAGARPVSDRVERLDMSDHLDMVDLAAIHPGLKSRDLDVAARLASMDRLAGQAAALVRREVRPNPIIPIHALMILRPEVARG